MVQFRHPFSKSPDLRLPSCRVLPGLPQFPDLGRFPVPLSPDLLAFRDALTALSVQQFKGCHVQREPASGEPGLNLLEVIPDKCEIVHPVAMAT
jgi:hypothetical protein